MSDIFDFIEGMATPPVFRGGREKTFDFREQLAVGDMGEKDFKKAYQVLEPKKSQVDLAYDFILKDKKRVELKTDSYPMDKSPNFFMETVSDIQSGKLGGPFRAYKDGIEYFVYYFIEDCTYFWFETKKLHDALEALIASGKYQLKSIKNKGWTAEGYAIPREALRSVVLYEDYIP